MPDLTEIPLDKQYQNVLCTAVLMHLPSEHLLATLVRVSDLLTPRGRLILTYRYSQSHDEREDDGRLFISILPGRLELMLGAVGLRVLHAESQIDIQRPGVRWQTIVAEKSPDRSDRGLDRLQSILVADRKDATYKLALLRALCDISRVEASRVTWAEEEVYVPLKSVAAWWLRYYWPLVNSPQLIIQKRGEDKGNKPLAFRRNLEVLAAQFGNLFNALQALDDDPEPFTPHLRKIAQTIRVGPVQFAGGPSATIFGFAAQPNNLTVGADPWGWIVVPQTVWLDLTRYEHWIRDSVIIHWAELTAEMNHDRDVGRYLTFLTDAPENERDTQEVRQMLSRRSTPLTCVWSGQLLHERYAIDHVIPYSIWGNNDLWNMLPADPKMNQQKSNALPTRSLLLRRRDSIIVFWREYREHWPARFATQMDRALARTMVGGANWEKASFAALEETIERLAVSRGLKRWEPKSPV